VEIIEKYRKFCRRVPLKIHVMEVLKMVGKEGLKKILENGDPQRPACGKFLPKI
jgi:predicted nucleic acid-binding OB-fold protein